MIQIVTTITRSDNPRQPETKHEVFQVMFQLLFQTIVSPFVSIYKFSITLHKFRTLIELSFFLYGGRLKRLDGGGPSMTKSGKAQPCLAA